MEQLAQPGRLGAECATSIGEIIELAEPDIELGELALDFTEPRTLCIDVVAVRHAPWTTDQLAGFIQLHVGHKDLVPRLTMGR